MRFGQADQIITKVKHRACATFSLKPPSDRASSVFVETRVRKEIHWKSSELPLSTSAIMARLLSESPRLEKFKVLSDRNIQSPSMLLPRPPHFGRGIWIVRHRPRYLTPGGQPETTIMQPPRFHLCRGMSLRAASVRRKDDQQFWDWKWKLQSSNILSSSSLARFCPTQRPRFLLTLLSVCSYLAVYHIFDTPQY